MIGQLCIENFEDVKFVNLDIDQQYLIARVAQHLINTFESKNSYALPFKASSEEMLFASHYYSYNCEKIIMAKYGTAQAMEIIK